MFHGSAGQAHGGHQRWSKSHREHQRILSSRHSWETAAENIALWHPEVPSPTWPRASCIFSCSRCRRTSRAKKESGSAVRPSISRSQRTERRGDPPSLPLPSPPLGPASTPESPCTAPSPAPWSLMGLQGRASKFHCTSSTWCGPQNITRDRIRATWHHTTSLCGAIKHLPQAPPNSPPISFHFGSLGLPLNKSALLRAPLQRLKGSKAPQG